MEQAAFDKKYIALRREFHRYPEPAWLEYRTTARIIQHLEELGLRPRWGRDIHQAEARMGLPGADTDAAWLARAVEETGRGDLIQRMAGGFTGVVVEIDGALPGPSMGVRVDIDSNDLTESEDLSHRPAREGFASCHPGAMHACGHDGHIAIGLGLAELLAGSRDRLRGKVTLFFQAAEEGGRGAQSLVARGLLDPIRWFWSGHIGINDAPVGTVSASTYGFLSGTKFDVTFLGRASHAGKAPEEGHNALAAASNAVLNLLAIPRSGKGVSRVNVGMMEGGSGRNVIPDYARICAEARGGNQEVSDYMLESALRVCRAAADMYQCRMEQEIRGRSMTVACDPELAEFAARRARELPGIREVVAASDMGAGENVTFMMDRVQKRGGKATFLLLGGGITAPHHSRAFDFDEAVIPLAARLFASIALGLGETEREDKG